jgi:hypothetical protein
MVIRLCFIFWFRAGFRRCTSLESRGSWPRGSFSWTEARWRAMSVEEREGKIHVLGEILL